MELAILVGLPGSGKTSFYRERLAATHRHVSKDLLARVRDKDARQRQLIIEALEAGQPVAVDNINATAAERARLVEVGRARGARLVAYHVEADVRACVARNRARAGQARVPDVAIHVAARRLEPPRRAEGFDAVYRVRLTEGGGFAVEPAPAEAEAG